MKTTSLFSILTLSVLIISGCSSTKTDPYKDAHIYRDQVGTLSWKGSPAADGAGMLFIVGEIEYGAPGTPDDYSQLFQENQYELEVEADFKVTGEETVRGWGSTFPAIEFIRIERI